MTAAAFAEGRRRCRREQDVELLGGPIEGVLGRAYKSSSRCRERCDEGGGQASQAACSRLSFLPRLPSAP